jgi:NAD+ kinase
MAAFAFVVHPLREEAASVALDTIGWLISDGHRVVLPVEDAALLGRPDLGVSDAELVQGLDLAVSLGGDGTMLRTVALVARHEVPVLGVNLGTLGYLTDIEPDGLRPALERVLAGEHLIEERMLLALEIDAPSGGATETAALALNEAVLEKQQSGHTVWLDVVINSELFATYSADGLIVSTPTGSTAYSMSARGPVVSPRHRALLVTPVSPHMLFDRALVLDPHESLLIEVVGTRPVDMALDGRKVMSLTQGDVVSFAPDTCTAEFLRFKTPKFHQIVRTKFGLGDD